MPARVVDVNVGGTINVADAATASPRLRRLVAFSSSAVYGSDAGAADAVRRRDRLRPEQPLRHRQGRGRGDRAALRRAARRCPAQSFARRGVYGAARAADRDAAADEPRPSSRRRAAGGAPCRRARPGRRARLRARRRRRRGDRRACSPRRCCAHDGLQRRLAARAVAWRETRGPRSKPAGSMRAGPTTRPRPTSRSCPPTARPALSIERLRAEIGFAPRASEEGIAGLSRRRGRRRSRSHEPASSRSPASKVLLRLAGRDGARGRRRVASRSSAARRSASSASSGSGKSVTALAIMRLVPTPPGRIVGGSIRFEGRDLLRADRPTRCAASAGARSR